MSIEPNDQSNKDRTSNDVKSKFGTNKSFSSFPDRPTDNKKTRRVDSDDEDKLGYIFLTKGISSRSTQRKRVIDLGVSIEKAKEKARRRQLRERAERAIAKARWLINSLRR